MSLRNSKRETEETQQNKAMMNVMFTSLLPLIACTNPPQPSEDLQELYDLGLDQYLGSITPSETSSLENGTQYEFSTEDGPMCLFGDSFRAATREEDSNNLLIYLQGGGACWSEMCLAFSSAQSDIPSSGVLNQDLEANPFRGWDIGYVPYCDGSLFTGDAQVDINGDGSIDRYHHGLINLSAALDAIHNDFPDPDRIVMTGMSAGGYGITLSGGLARVLWPDVPITLVADGGLGLGRTNDSNFIPDILDEWNVTSWIPNSCDNCFDRGHAIGFTSWILQRDANLEYLAISAYYDYVIANIFLNIDGEEYAQSVLDETAILLEKHPQQTARFLFDGYKHTTLALDSETDLSNATTLPFDIGTADQLDAILGRYDDISVDDLTVADWLSRWVNGDRQWNSVTE